MSPLIVRESDQKMDRATRKKNMKLLSWSKRNPPSSTQAIGRGRKEKECWEIDDPPPRFQLNWRRNRTFLAALQTELELSLR
ncbi:hypothetical protein CEXT_538311 [Caerostris extrusa]|uniref:Uncharacterized protein n=1 Tax=Caerostris extrusa TaxID=172846 RepID=A0AAV4P027_CAEEX|nr:hypothetical protein CEXT_538311 [Caerostris extrusa]